MRQTGKLSVKEEENFGTKNVAKIKTGLPEDQKPTPPPPMMPSATPEENPEEQMMV